MSIAPTILVLNSGSSSLKFALYAADHCTGRGTITGIGQKASLSAKGELFTNKTFTSLALGDECHTTTDATRILINWIKAFLPPNNLAAVGHRVVHGGDLTKSMRVTPDLMGQLKSLSALAPLHQPYNIESIRLIAELYPDIPQVACFDTVFHNTIEPLHRCFALPRRWYDQGVKRYGFHGLSYEYIAGRLLEIAPRAFAGRTIAAHLGSGASLCALKNGNSFDVSTGFSALDGLVMGTRPGTLDAGVVLYFLQEAQFDAKTISEMLYLESGLLGVSGISSDMAKLLASQEPTARDAIDLFCLRITQQAGGLISLLGGIDAIVFTGGIGEHATSIRTQVCKSLEWIGVELDVEKNNEAKSNQETLLASPRSKVDIWLIPTDEESVIAHHTRVVISKIPLEDNNAVAWPL